MSSSGIGKSERLLRRAMQYVSDYWLPVNQALLQRIRLGLDTGAYDTDRFLLIDELAADPGLFFGCIRELREMLAHRELEALESTDLTEIIEAADLEMVRLAIAAISERPCVHIMSEGDEQQVSRLLEAIMSAASARTLAPGYGESPGSALSIAALRQLGYALIAWNYPTIYKESLEELQDSPDSTLDEILVTRFGFSPFLLAARLAHQWGLPRELSDAAMLPAMPLYEEAHIVSAATTTLSEICRVSEALARIQFEHLYPSARREWDAARLEVEKHLGARGMEQIREACADACRFVLTSSPDVFRAGELLDQLPAAPEEPKLTGDSNPFVHECDLELKEKFAQLYSLIPRGRPSEHALKFLLREVVPTAEFSGGCIFTVDPASCCLIPQLELGTLELRGAGPVSYLNDAVENDPVHIAFVNAEGCRPITSEHTRENLGSITAAFGRSQRLGVIYLELPLQTLRGEGRRQMVHFQAVSHALLDCLGL